LAAKKAKNYKEDLWRITSNSQEGKISSWKIITTLKKLHPLAKL